MLKTFNSLLSIRASTTTNLLIFYIQKLPIIGKHLKDNLYANLELKKVVSIFALIFTQLFGVILRFLYVGLMIFLPVMALGEALPEEERLKHFVHIFTMLSFIAASVSSATVLEPKREKYVAVKLMRMSPTRYMQATFAFRYVTFLVYLLPAMLLFITLLGASIFEAFQLAVLITMWRLIAEYAHLKFFEKTGKVLVKQVAIVWIVIFASYAAAYFPLILSMVPPTEAIILSLPAGIIILVGGLYAAYNLARYSGYREVVDAATKRDDPLMDLGRMMSESQQKSVKTKDSDYVVDSKGRTKIEAKDGYAYLNAIFFIRHRSLISSPVNKRLAIVGAFGVLGTILALIFNDHIQVLDVKLDVIFPFLILIMYFLSAGENLCKAMFYNCDLSLMRYSFYRRSAFQHFRIRLVKLISLNMLVATALGLSFTAMNIAAGGEWLSIELLMLWLCVISLSIFFSVHHLFMYYILQPYSTELNLKNPLYIILNMVVSSASGFSIFMRPPTKPFTIVIVALMFIYLVVGLLLVRKYGEKTFRVK